MSLEKKAPLKRKHIRFKPEGIDTALVDWRDNKTFKPEIPALIYQESAGGCAIIISGPSKLPVAAIFQVKLGLMNPRRVEIRWIKEFDQQVAVIGLKFLD